MPAKSPEEICRLFKQYTAEGDFDGFTGRDALDQQCENYMSLLEISSDDLISQSYSDLLAHSAPRI